MKRVTRAIRNPALAARYLLVKLGFSRGHILAWKARGYAAPSPDFIKRDCVLRNGLAQSTWVETGTYLGETTKLLAEVGKRVYSIEPEPTLHARAQKLFAGRDNVEIIHGLSEDVFPTLLPKIRGDVSFWLDGHFSGGATHKGPLDTPISQELVSIGANLATMGRVAVMVDDIRLFTGETHSYGAYPTLDYLVDWARKYGLSWHIEHDIFIAKTP